MRKILALVLAALLACAALPAFAEGEAPFWINSNVIGNVTADTETSLRDDFHLAVNKDWLVAAKIPEGETQISAFTELDRTVREQILSLLQGPAQESYEGQLVQKLYADYMDMDARNERGMSPVMPFLEEIQKISTLEELTAYTLRLDQLSNALCGSAIMADFMDSTKHSVFVAGATLTLGDADEYKQMTSVGERTKAAIVSMLEKLLARAGYGAEDAQATIERMFELEAQIASASQGSAAAKQPDYLASIYNPVTVEELAEMSPVFPITKMLGGYIEAGVDRFILMDSGWLAKMNELYTEENLEGFKAMLLCGTLRSAALYLDQDCIDIVDAASSAVSGMTVKSVLADTAYTACSSMLNMAIGRMYCENFVSPETKKDVEGIIADVVAIYKKRLENNTWLGAETRQKALEKLDALRVNVAYPDDWSKYDVSDIVFSEDGGLLNDILVVAAHSYRENIKRATEAVDRDRWQMSPQTVNAFYNPSDNSINILAGILAGAFYDAEGSMEGNLGGIGVVIAHEITHGFDTQGSQYDKDGNMLSWWTDEDHAAFTERTDKVDAYFSAIEVLPGQYVDGQLTIGETVADLGAISCTLEMAKDYENFDYDAFFTAFARVWPRQMPLEMQEVQLKDVHAPGYLRTNVTVQQFQEFYDTYGVVEGDGMYVAPEKRLSVW